jgi:two-component system chemotaxis response regulator CheY
MAKIMVVDDSNLSRRVTRKILEAAGHSVIDAEDGLSALEHYCLEKPDVVLLDVTMRGMNGIEVLGRLRELNPEARVIILTADVQSSTREMTTDGGACGFVTKPIVSEPVLQAVDAALRGAKPCS